MGKQFKNILLFHKKSAYSIYFLERKIKMAKAEKANLKTQIKRFKQAHDEHYETLRQIEHLLIQYGIQYSKRFRGSKINYARHDLIITVGGDGTFLEAASSVRGQVIIGINSSSSTSVGKLCAGNSKNIDQILKKIKIGALKISRWPRLRLTLDGYARPVDCVNDVLVAHSGPAAMSRYNLKIGNIKEEQRSSGLWISSAAGSSGAIKSAGGRILKSGSKTMQYKPRELYEGFNKRYKLKGAVLRKNQGLTVTSLMRCGKIFVDGTHFQLKFPFNTNCKISFSPDPIKTIKLN